MVNNFSAESEQRVPNVEPANEEEPTKEELEPIEHEPDEMKEASDNKNQQQQQPATKDTVFDLFRDEVVEENNTSKLAAALNNVDVHDLLEEAQNLRNQLRGAVG